MPIDKMMSDAMLENFRKMAKECHDKGCKGEHFDKMIKALNRMEELAEILSDINEFNATIVKEDLFMNFTNHYGAVLAGEAEKASPSDPKSEQYDDANLLANTLKAYEDAIKQIEKTQSKTLEGKSGYIKEKITTGKELIEPLEKLIELGKSGISYPVFLTKMMEQGLDKLLEGQAIIKKGIEYDLENAREMGTPPKQRMHEERLKTFDEMAKKSEIGVPDAFEFSLEDEYINWKYQPEIEKWKAITHVWEKMFEALFDWLDSYCYFAPHDDRWQTAGGSASSTEKNIRREKGCTPGIFKQRERILKEYFSVNWDDIFKHETFCFSYKEKNHHFPYSEERFQLIKDTYAHCNPKNENEKITIEPPPNNLIKLAEELHDKKMCQNPNIENGIIKNIELYEKFYGKGSYEKEFGKNKEQLIKEFHANKH